MSSGATSAKMIRPSGAPGEGRRELLWGHRRVAGGAHCPDQLCLMHACVLEEVVLSEAHPTLRRSWADCCSDHLSLQMAFERASSSLFSFVTHLRANDARPSRSCATSVHWRIWADIGSARGGVRSVLDQSETVANKGASGESPASIPFAGATLSDSQILYF